MSDFVSGQSRPITDAGDGPSGITSGRLNQSSETTAEETDQSGLTLGAGASQPGGDRLEDEDEYSESLLQDHPLRMFTLNQSLHQQSSQSHQRTLVQISGSQSEAIRTPINQSHPASVHNDASTNQSAPLDDEDASEVIHAPHQRHRMVLDSHTDEEEVARPTTIDLSLLLNASVVVANQLGLVRANRSRIRVIAPSEYDDDTDSGSENDVTVINVASDSDTNDEPMEVEASVTMASMAGLAPAAPVQTAPSWPAPVQPSQELSSEGPARTTPLSALVAQTMLPGPASVSAPAPTEPAPVHPSSTASAATAAPSSHTAPASSTAPATSTAPTKDSMQDFKSPKKITTPSTSATGDDSDDESQSCIICYEPWTNSGDHRLASLKCGHLFGHCCILKWLKETANLKCPQCNAKAKKSDVRIIYAKALRTIDTSERDRALNDLRKEKENRRKAEIDMAQTNLRYRMAVEEMQRLKAQISTQQVQLRNASSLQKSTSAPGQSATPSNQWTVSSHAPRGQYNLDKTIQISQNGNCRVMGFDQFQSALVVSMTSPNQLFPGFGVKKISAVDQRCTQYVPVHTAMIRGLAFNGRNDGLMLTASMDKSIKITSLVSNAVVQMYKTDAPVWSCTWNSSDVNYVYAGLQNGAILVFDTRQVNGEVQRLTLDNSRCPVVSLSYIPKAADQALGCSGLLMASLGGTSFWEQTSDVEFKPHLLQMDGICTSLSFNNTSRHCLASFRPNKNHNSTRHVMCELRNEKNDATSSSEVACYPVQTFYGGPTMKVLTRSILFPSPDRPGQLYACSGDEASSSALIWDTTTGNQTQKLKVNATVLDVCSFQLSRRSFLAALTDKQVKLYTWQPTK